MKMATCFVVKYFPISIVFYKQNPMYLPCLYSLPNRAFELLKELH